MKKMIACCAIQAVFAGAAFAQKPPMNQAAAPAPAQAPPAPPLGSLETKAALCQIDNLLSPVDALPVPSGESALCQPSYSIETVSKYLVAGGALFDFKALGEDLTSYYLFRALAFSSADQCRPLGQLSDIAVKSNKDARSWEDDCRGHFGEIRISRALITHDPQLGALCLETMQGESDPAEQCRKIVANAGDLNAAAAAVCEGSSEKKKTICVDFYRVASGDAAACRSQHTRRMSTCLGITAFAKAGPAKNPALCGQSQVCLAMSGDAGANRASVHAERLIAGDMSPILFVEAQAKLKALNAAVDPLNAAASKEIDAREERIALLRMKLDPASRKPAKALVKGGGGNEQDK
jgi:hypothetical protein